MTSVRARFVASLALAVTATVVPVVGGSAYAAPAPSTSLVSAGTARTAIVVAPASTASAAASSSTTAGSAMTAVLLPSGRVIVTRAALRNAVVRGRLIVAVAARYRGVPYVAGGTSPRSGFDCSGYTRYVFSRLGISIPRVSRAQYSSMIHISRSQAVPGDLVFFHSANGRVYHVAIYAGHNTVWHSPYPGLRVKRERIWTSAVYFGRVRV